MADRRRIIWINSGFYRRGIADNDASTADIKLIHEAYLEGLNHYIDTSEGKLPIEYTLLGFKPRRWSSEDLCAFERFSAYCHTHNHKTQSDTCYLVLCAR
jgi:penicillin amidase